MSNKAQTSKNIELTGKLLDYLSRGKNIPNLPEDVSIVPFSRNNKKLNSANDKLVKVLNKEKPVAIAEEPKAEKKDWKIIPVNF